MMKIVATTSLPAFDRPNAGRWNANTRAKNGALRETLVIYQQTKRLMSSSNPFNGFYEGGGNNIVYSGH